MIKTPRKKLLVLLALLVGLSAWIYWNRPQRDDMAAYVPADSLGFIEANDLPAIADGLVESEAWRTLAGPMGAPTKLLPQRWLIRLARWTGIGSIDAVLAARSQVALVFTQTTATQRDTTITIKPLSALIIQTHTTQRRMRPALEKHFEQFAQRAYGQPTVTRKQVEAVDLIEWSSADNTRRIVATFVDTVAIVGNDESVVLHCVNVSRGNQPSLSGDMLLKRARESFAGPNPSLFGFIPKAGVKPIIEAWALSRAGNSSDAATVARLLSTTFGNLIDSFAWASRLDNGGAEDRFSVALSPGVSESLANSMSPSASLAAQDFSFVPPEAASVTSYRLGSPERFWQDLNAVISSRSDVLGSIASRPLLRGLLEPYGIQDADAFFSAVGPNFQVIRVDNNSPAVLVAESFDRPALRALAEKRTGAKFKAGAPTESELIISKADGWGAAFEGNYFLTGPADALRRCLSTKAQGPAIGSASSFRRAQALVDVSLPIFSLTFSDDRAAAITFVELFSQQERSAFSSNAAGIQQSSQLLPYAVTVTMLKSGRLEWTSRSSFGLSGLLFTTFAPEKAR